MISIYSTVRMDHLGWDNNLDYTEDWKLLWSKLPMIIVNGVTQINQDNNKP